MDQPGSYEYIRSSRKGQIGWGDMDTMGDVVGKNQLKHLVNAAARRIVFAHRQNFDRASKFRPEL